MALPLIYSWRNLFVRKFSTALTFLVVGVIVFVLAVLLSFAVGIQASLKASGSPKNIIVLKPGATAESTSFVTHEEFTRLTQTPGIARSASGELLLSRELCVQASIPRREDPETMANVAVRGVDMVAFDIHDDLTISEGRMFEPQAMEVIVGAKAARRYMNLRPGSEIALGRLGNRIYKVVGTFTSNGGAFESEIWGPRTSINDSFQRDIISAGVLRLADGADPQAALDAINGPAIELAGKLEPDYYKELSSKATQIVVLTIFLIVFMAGGAVFAVANTMYAAVDGRKRELAMLRTLGFSTRAIRVTIVLEALLICGTACVAGLAASLLLNGREQDFLSDTTWTVLAYSLKITPLILGSCFLAACGVGILGALAPASRAARIPILQALRKS